MSGFTDFNKLKLFDNQEVEKVDKVNKIDKIKQNLNLQPDVVKVEEPALPEISNLGDVIFVPEEKPQESLSELDKLVKILEENKKEKKSIANKKPLPQPQEFDFKKYLYWGIGGALLFAGIKYAGNLNAPADIPKQYSI